MRNQLKKSLNRFTGPFACFYGSEGVDNTVDVVCLKTGAAIATYRYWEMELAARQAASLVATALNRAAGFSVFTDWIGDALVQATELDADELRRACPFRSVRRLCEHTGPVWYVLDGADRTLIEATDWYIDAKPKRTSQIIATAMNQFVKEIQGGLV